MRTIAGLMVVLALAATGCNGVSQVDRSAPVRITGVFHHDDGSPAGDLPVAMAKELGPAEAFEAMWTVFSFGTLCLVPDPPDICRDRGAVSRTAHDGTYALDVRGADTQSFLGFASTMAVTAAAPAPAGARSGPATTLRFAVDAQQMALPAARLWQAAPVIGAEPGVVTVSAPAPPSWMGTPESLRVVAETATGALVWGQGVEGSAARIDARLLEDFAAGIVVQAEGGLAAPNLTVDAAYRTAQMPVTGPGPAPSRGAACTVHDQHGPTVASPCALTDGNLATALEPSMPQRAPGEPPPPPPAPGEPAREESVVVDLGVAAPRSLVVLRGDPFDLRVELSADGVTWTAPVTAQPDGPVAAVPVQGDARYVRVRTAAGPVTRLVEVSVW